MEAIVPWKTMGCVKVGESSVNLGEARVPPFTVSEINPTGVVVAVDCANNAEPFESNAKPKNKNTFFIAVINCLRE